MGTDLKSISATITLPMTAGIVTTAELSQGWLGDQKFVIGFGVNGLLSGACYGAATAMCGVGAERSQDVPFYMPICTYATDAFDEDLNQPRVTGPDYNLNPGDQVELTVTLSDSPGKYGSTCTMKILNKPNLAPSVCTYTNQGKPPCGNTA